VAAILIITEAKTSFLCVQINRACHQQAQRFCRNDSDSCLESLIVTGVTKNRDSCLVFDSSLAITAFRSEPFLSRDSSVLVASVSGHFVQTMKSYMSSYFMQIYLNQRKVLVWKPQTQPKIQQLTSISLWFSC